MTGTLDSPGKANAKVTKRRIAKDFKVFAIEFFGAKGFIKFV